MMKLKKRLLVIVSSVIFVISALVGCGSKVPNKPEGVRQEIWEEALKAIPHVRKNLSIFPPEYGLENDANKNTFQFTGGTTVEEEQEFTNWCVQYRLGESEKLSSDEKILISSLFNLNANLLHFRMQLANYNYDKLNALSGDEEAKQSIRDFNFDDLTVTQEIEKCGRQLEKLIKFPMTIKNSGKLNKILNKAKDDHEVLLNSIK